MNKIQILDNKKVYHVYVENGKDNIVEVQVYSEQTDKLIGSTKYPHGIKKSDLPTAGVNLRRTEQSKDIDAVKTFTLEELIKQNKMLKEVVDKLQKDTRPVDSKSKKNKKTSTKKKTKK